jgi:predicted transcriptional regulator
MTDTTVTVRLSTALRDRLERIGAATKRSKSFLAQEAIERYVAEEEPHILGIMKALEEMKAGKGIPHEEVMRQLDETIAAASKKRA